jgi:hypothetical protein
MGANLFTEGEMFKTKKAMPREEALTNGWREHDLKMLASTLSSDRPVIRTNITGFRQSFTFDGVPGSEQFISYHRQENELVGTYSFDRVIVQGTFGVASECTDLDPESFGWVNISYLDHLADDRKIPLLQFRFAVGSADEQRQLQDALRASVINGTTSLNFVVDPVDDTESWIKTFREDSLSPSARIRKIYIGAQTGRGAFD